MKYHRYPCFSQLPPNDSQHSPLSKFMSLSLSLLLLHNPLHVISAALMCTVLGPSTIVGNLPLATH